MIIDLILDRRDGVPYIAKDFYENVLAYEETTENDSISYCMDYFGESLVQKALCEYIDRNNYNPAICDYIRSVQWLIND